MRLMEATRKARYAEVPYHGGHERGAEKRGKACQVAAKAMALPKSFFSPFPSNDRRRGHSWIETHHDSPSIP